MNIAFNKDIMSWDKFPEYDIIWCDPPWQQKMVNYFETMMQKSGQAKPNNKIDKILQKLAKLANNDKPIFIEYSLNGFLEVVKIMEKEGHFFSAKIDSIQENGRPYCILTFNTDFLLDGRVKGFKIIDYVCDHFTFQTVFDPFAGIGKTARFFIKNRKFYIGSEINTERFNKLKKVVWAGQQ